ncbi:MAG: hypothetical protein [Caudoviricetes sp.]|nr:MAG: hypothetical protein [Caudoviricetes sp.]
MDDMICNIDGCYDECVFRTGNITDCDIAHKLMLNGKDETQCQHFISEEYLSHLIEFREQEIKRKNEIYNQSIKLREENKNKQMKILNFLRDGYYDRYEEGIPRYKEKKSWKKYKGI